MREILSRTDGLEFKIKYRTILLLISVSLMGQSIQRRAHLRFF